MHWDKNLQASPQLKQRTICSYPCKSCTAPEDIFHPQIFFSLCFICVFINVKIMNWMSSSPSATRNLTSAVTNKEAPTELTSAQEACHVSHSTAWTSRPATVQEIWSELLSSYLEFLLKSSKETFLWKKKTCSSLGFSLLCKLTYVSKASKGIGW